jgi:hypothetical protein
MTRGILTVAVGHSVYYQMAYYLALSLRRHAKELPIALVTDAPSAKELRIYDTILCARPEFGDGFAQKLHFLDYSPYDETVFLDCDSLVVRDLMPIWNFFDGVSFGYLGSRIQYGLYYGANVESLCAMLGIPWIGVMNGGFYFARKDAAAAQIFQDANEVYKNYHSYGFATLGNGQRSEEPCFAVATGKRGIAPIEDHGKLMRTPFGLQGRLDIDVLAGRCDFVKHGTPVSPAVVHFASPWRFHPTYGRECLKLRLANSAILNPLKYAVPWCYYYTRRACQKVQEHLKNVAICNGRSSK